MVNHGFSGTTSSADHGKSTSAGATLTRTHLPIRSLPPVTNMVNSGTTALLTGHYELTMLQAALRSGAASRRGVFEVFARQLPHGRRYGVVAGTGRLLDALERFRFGPQELAFLRDSGIVDETTLRYLSSYRFGGNIWGYAEGDVYFPGSPIIVVEGTFAEAVLLETLVLSIMNHDSAIASAASRMVTAAGGPGGRPLIEMGSRRTHERAAVAAARAAYIAGFASTSNLGARFCYGVPSGGTSAHAFTLVHDSDLPALAVSVRSLLDSLGATSTRIIMTGDLDEYSIAGLAVAPVDGYGVGTSLVTGSGAPTAALVYKLVARSDEPLADGTPAGLGALRPVAKRSVGKPGRGGRKWAVRERTDIGVAATERIWLKPPELGPNDRLLLQELVHDGRIVGREPIEAARTRHTMVLAELPSYALQLSRGYPAIPTVFGPDREEA